MGKRAKSGHVGLCEVTGKYMLVSKKAAKKFASQIEPRAPGHLSQFRCEHCDYIHNGHLSPGVRHGVYSRPVH